MKAAFRTGLGIVLGSVVALFVGGALAVLGAFFVAGDCTRQEDCPGVHLGLVTPMALLGLAAGVSLGLWVGWHIARPGRRVH
jgi:hypothetical protein